jgi:two-component system response regulator WspF
MRVAIVNDVPLATEALRRVVCSDPGHTVAWTAADGREAVQRCRTDTPDVILMDLLMPVMNGVEATRQIMRENPCAILVVTATVSGNFSLVCEALGCGAYDAVTTPTLGGAAPQQAGAELLAKLQRVDAINRRLGRTTTPVGPVRRGSPTPPQPPPVRRGSPTPPSLPTEALPTVPVVSSSPRTFPLVAIGSSTGGPPALQAIFSRWPQDFPATVVVAQHVGAEFAGSLVDWLQQFSRLPVVLARQGDVPRPGIVFLAATDDHLVLARDRTLSYTSDPEDYPYRPSVDALFHSLVAHWPTSGVAVLLTGIGRDGAAGLLALRQAGWCTIAQDQATSVVYGMPQAAAQIGAARRILPLHEIAGHVAFELQRQATQ